MAGSNTEGRQLSRIHEDSTLWTCEREGVCFLGRGCLWGSALRFKRAVIKDLPKTSQTHKPSCLDNAKKKWPEAHTQGQRLPTEPFGLLLGPCLRGPPENNFLLQLKSWQDFPTEGHKTNVWAICSGHNKCTLCEDSLRGDLWVQTHCVQ